MISYFKNTLAKKEKQGFTLVEVILALALSAVVLGAVTLSFQVVTKNGKKNFSHDELVQHARVAMDRMTSELRYAIKISDMTGRIVSDTNGAVLEFHARALDGDANDIETIRYQWNMITKELERFTSEMPGIVNPIAGSQMEGIEVVNFQREFFKISSGVLDNSLLTDPLDTIKAVRLTITMQDRYNNIVDMRSTAKLLNN